MGESGTSKDDISQCKKALVLAFGKAIHGNDLWRLLGFAAESSYREAARQGKLSGVPLKPIPLRNGKYVSAVGLAKYLVNAGIDWKERIASARRKTSDNTLEQE